MSKRMALVLPILAAAACAEPATGVREFEVPVFRTEANHGYKEHDFRADLTGAAERPVPRVTDATGRAKFKLSADGETLRYQLWVEDIENVTQAHIHLGPVEGSGGIVVWLYGLSLKPPQAFPAGGGPIEGKIADGVLDASYLVNALAGQQLSVLVDHILAGNAYVNVHTSSGSSTLGPGNFPGGEIRGQLEAHPE